LTQTDLQLAAGRSRREAAVKALNLHYYYSSSGTENSRFIGSWAKSTQIRPPRDVDVFYLLPISVYNRYNGKGGNVQSQILQEVKGVIQKAHAATAVKGSGPIVEVGFAAYNVEIAPGFNDLNGRQLVCSTTNGGNFKTADYAAEVKSISDSNAATNGNTRDLVRMAKCWQSYCSVPMRSFWLEMLAISFLSTWEYKGKSKTYYDWMCRDFFKSLTNKANGTLYAPGTWEAISIGAAWLSRAQTAYGRAAKACDLETEYPYTAGGEWQKIFGTDIPVGG
tara:strand:- start:1368 stop:2204 length:837 start_codon:yes stop_codon:yes gene_type:complete